MDDNIATVEEMAAEYKNKPSWWYAAAAANRVPHVRLGKYIRFERDRVSEWIAAQRREPKSKSKR